MDGNVANIMGELKRLISGVLEKDISAVNGFNERQLEAIAIQTDVIQRGIANGEIDEDLSKFFMKGLEAMAYNFVQTLKGILLVTIEKVWNAVINFLYKAVGIIP